MAINSWKDVSLKDLFYAFRKAKADCFFENSICISLDFSEYEKNLSSNLSALLIRLRNNDLKNVFNENLGEIRIISKKLGVEKKREGNSNGHTFFHHLHVPSWIYIKIMI